MWVGVRRVTLTRIFCRHQHGGRRWLPAIEGVQVPIEPRESSSMLDERDDKRWVTKKGMDGAG